jgi:hypothetical protein
VVIPVVLIGLKSLPGLAAAASAEAAEGCSPEVLLADAGLLEALTGPAVLSPAVLGRIVVFAEVGL